MKKVLYILIFISYFAQSQTASLIIGDGQSNMAGILSLGVIDYALRAAPYVEILDSTTNNFQHLIHFPTGKDYSFTSQPTRGKYIVPFTTLAINIDSLARGNYYMVMHAKGGTQLYQDVSLIDWNVNSVGELYDNYVSAITRAIDLLNQRGVTVDTIHRIKFQGESDATTELKANAFYQNESDFIDSLETEFNYPFKHILIEISDDYTYSTTVNAALSTIAGERSNATLYTNDSFIYSVDLHHITNDSQISLGDSLFKLIDENY